MDNLTHIANKRGLLLDPRTKLVMLITVTSLMLSTGNSGVMNIVKPALSAIPFALLLSERKWKTSAKYLALYAACFALERMALHMLSGAASFILLAVCSVMTRFAPGFMMGAFLISTTSVSDFLAAMKRMHITEKIIIPMSVIFRFFPTIREENDAIRDAMRMRGIRFGGKRPGKIIEYRLIPLMISVVKIGDELSAAALTRGLGAPVRRTDICKIGFHIQDAIMFILCIAGFALTLGSGWFS